MRIFKVVGLLFGLGVIAGSNVACTSTTEIDTRYENQSTGPQGTSTNSGSSSTKVKRTGWPISLNWGVSDSYDSGPADILPRGTVLIAGPGPWCPTIARRPSGQEECVSHSGNIYPPYRNRYGSGGYYGTGEYYYNPRTGRQERDLRPGFR